jgi:hypothetical protein
LTLKEAKSLLRKGKTAEANALLDKALALTGVPAEMRQDGYVLKVQIPFSEKKFAEVVATLKAAKEAAPQSRNVKHIDDMIAHFSKVAEAQETAGKLEAGLAKSEGIDRAKLLDKLVDAKGIIVEADPAARASITKWSKEIIDLDPDNKAGLKKKYVDLMDAEKGEEGETSALAKAETDAPKVSADLWNLVRQPGVLTDAAARAAALEKAEPMLATLDRYAAEAKKWGPGMHWLVDQTTSTAEQIRALLGEPAFVAKLQSDAKSAKLDASSHAKALLARAEFFCAGKDAAAQGKALDSFLAALKLDPANKDLAKFLAMCHYNKETTKEIAARIEDILAKDATSDYAKMAIKRWVAERKLSE